MSTEDHNKAAGCSRRHSLSEVARQCEADMSGQGVPHLEETGELETGDLAYQGYTYKALNPISTAVAMLTQCCLAQTATLGMDLL